MKKVLLGALVLFLMASCSDNNDSGKEIEEPNRITDSLEQVKTLRQTKEVIQAAREQERLDSIRQDSIRRDSLQMDFVNQFITPIELVDKSNPEYYAKDSSEIKKILKAKGYKIKNFDDGLGWSAKKDGKNPITGAYYKQEFEFGCGARCAMSIEFANKQDAKNFYKGLDKYNSVYQLNETEFRKIWEIEDNWIDVIC